MKRSPVHLICVSGSTIVKCVNFSRRMEYYASESIGRVVKYRAACQALIKGSRIVQCVPSSVGQENCSVRKIPTDGIELLRRCYIAQGIKCCAEGALELMHHVLCSVSSAGFWQCVNVRGEWKFRQSVKFWWVL